MENYIEEEELEITIEDAMDVFPLIFNENMPLPELSERDEKFVLTDWAKTAARSA